MNGLKFRDLVYLKKPNRLIVKPIFAVMILKGTFVPRNEFPTDWENKTGL